MEKEFDLRRERKRLYYDKFMRTGMDIDSFFEEILKQDDEFIRLLLEKWIESEDDDEFPEIVKKLAGKIKNE